ncbi:MAG TPA: hypothetical protein VK974_04655 [Methylophilaceae bacterium]|nr:hypothetical protein [Methylophilaceae bacterium]
MKRILLLAALLAFSGLSSASVRVPAGANIQSYLNVSSGQLLILSAGAYSTVGLTCVSNMAIETDGKVTINSSSSAPIINLAGCSNVSIRGDLELVGNGAGYTSHPSSQVVDSGQSGIYLSGNDNIVIEGVRIRNIRGSGIEAHSTLTSWKNSIFIRGVSVKNSYRGIYLTDSAEYITLSDINASDNVFGIQIDSGNNTVVNAKTIYNSIGVKICGSINSYCSGANNAHGIFSGLESNHNYYNLVIVDVTVGETFSACHFVAGQSGSNAGTIQIINSKGINITGSQIGSNLTIDGNSVVSLQGSYMRSGLSGATVSPGGILISKNNFNDQGLWPGNN